MDPITTALLAGLAKLSEPAIKDAYEGLKALLVRKFTASGAVPAAVAGVEQNPASDARKGVLAEEINKVQAEKDDELVQAAKKVLQHVEATPGGKEAIHIIVTGDYNNVGGHDVTIGSNYTAGRGY